MRNYILLFGLAINVCLLNAQSWSTVSSGTTKDLLSISFGSPMVGYIGATDSTLLKTIDGGLTWNVQPTTGINFSTFQSEISQVHFVSEDVGYAVIGKEFFGGGVYKTVDGGLNWEFFPYYMCDPGRVYARDSSKVFLIGSSCFAGRTIDIVEASQVTYSHLFTYYNDYLRAIDFYDDDYGIVAGDSGYVYRTINGGQNWDTVQTSNPKSFLDIDFLTPAILYGSIDSTGNSLFISQDSGKTWTHHTNSMTFFYPQFEDVLVTSSNQIFTVGRTDISQEGFVTWGLHDSSWWGYETTSAMLHSVDLSNDSVVFAVGDSGLIVKNSAIINNVPEPEVEIQVDLFPNPASDYVKIVSTKVVSSVRVFDLKGQEVLHEFWPGNELNISGIVPGIYVVKIEMDGETQVKKLIIN